jgi:hypothetical protein
MAEESALALVEEAVRQYEQAMMILCALEWRQGRSNRGNLYARTGGADWKKDIFIGSIPAPSLAAQVVRDHNDSLIMKLGDRVGGS